MAHRLSPAIRTGLLVAALILTTALTAACRGVLATSGSGSGQQVTVKAHDTMRFDPQTITVPVGQPAQVTLARPSFHEVTAPGAPFHRIRYPMETQVNESV